MAKSAQRLLLDVLQMIGLYVPVALVATGVLTGIGWVKWLGIVLFGLELTALLVYAAILAYLIPKETIRDWSRFGLLGKIAAGGGVAVILLGVGLLVLGEIVLWSLSGRRARDYSQTLSPAAGIFVGNRLDFAA